jgi:hypothetical protein
MVQDDKPVGLDGLAVEFDDGRVVCDAGVIRSRRLLSGSASRRSRSGWCGCGVIGRAPPTRAAR